MRTILAFLALAFSISLAPAQQLLLGVGSPGVVYSGPGDIVSGATAWYSCSRGYSKAYSTGSNNACNIRRASDNSTTNIVILSNGHFDIATANSFAGTDATCSGSTTGSSTTIAFTSCSSTPKAADTVSGTGITQPAYLASCGTFTAGAGSCTLNVAQNIAVAETVTMQVAMYVTEAYDQSGNAHNASQSTASAQPQVLPNCGSAIPCLFFNGTSTQINPTGLSAYSDPITYSSVIERTGAFTSYGDVYRTLNYVDATFRFSASANSIEVCIGCGFSVTASDSTLHAFNAVLNGSSSVASVDGTTTTGTTTGSTISGGTAIGADGSAGSEYVTGFINEFGFWLSAFNSTQYGNMCHNQRLYWGTPGSC